MRSICRNTVFCALFAFAFAAGLAGSAFAAPDCSPCMVIYNSCMARPGADPELCAREHNRCAAPLHCRQLPE